VKPLRVAIIGYGKIAEDQHVPAILANPRLELNATVSRTGKGRDGAHSFTDHREMLEALPDLDAVVVATPPSARFDIARDCFDAGLHVMLEKPPANALAEAREMACLAEAAQRTLFASWHSRHNEAVDRTAEALAGQRVASMEIQWREDVRKWHPGQQWIWEPGGFGVFDPGINALSIVTRIFPGVLFVKQAELVFPENREAPIAAGLRFSSPVADGDLISAFDWRECEAESWTITIRTAEGKEVRLSRGGKRLEIDDAVEIDGEDQEYRNLFAHFVDLIDERRCDVDLRPLTLVADAFLLGRRSMAEPFED
jgi:D-galactose 1-dehydrogenase